jgi:hypothetical protein
MNEKKIMKKLDEKIEWISDLGIFWFYTPLYE